VYTVCANPLLRANRKVAARRAARKRGWGVGVYENISLYAIYSRAKQLLECHGECRRGARTSRHRRSTSQSNCNFIAFVSVRSTSFGNSITNDLFVGDHADITSRSGLDESTAVTRTRTKKNQMYSRFYKQKCLKGIDTFRPTLTRRRKRYSM